MRSIGPRAPAGSSQRWTTWPAPIRIGIRASSGTSRSATARAYRGPCPSSTRTTVPVTHSEEGETR